MVLAMSTSTSFFFFNDTATTEIYTLSLHDALPISPRNQFRGRSDQSARARNSRARNQTRSARARDRKSTRLNSSHSQISYAVFCLKKKNNSSTIKYNHTTLSTTTRTLPISHSHQFL